MFFRGNHSLVLFLVIAFTAKFCTGFDFDCDFESSSCGFRQITSWGNSGVTQDYHNWVLRAKSSTPEAYSGPAADHTTGSGYYMVFHAYAIRSFGTRAVVYKDITVTRDNTWISFWYHMYAWMEGNAQFRVYAGNTQIFSKQGNQGKGWKKAEIKLNVLGSVRLSFLAIKGGSHYANVGVDDIIVAEYWKPNITSLTARNRSVCLNNNVELECTANGFPPSEYSFYVNDQFVRKSYNGKQNIRTSTEGNATYRCEPTNNEGSGENATIEIHTNSLPNVLLPTVAVTQGSTLNLFCNATGNSPFQYVWKLGYNSQNTLPTSADNNYTKPGITRYDNRYFRCMVIDDNGCSALSPRIMIDIQYPPLSTYFRALQSAVCLNNMASFNCWASANPSTIDYGLHLDGQQILSSRSTRLTFNSTTVGTNTYVCKMNNSVGFGQNATATMVTKAPPQITGITPNQTVAEGTRLLLECNVSGSEPMTITWRKVGGLTFPSGKNITFERLTTADHGEYECTASNGNECPTTSSRTFVYVQYKPRRTNITISNSTVCLNDLVELECTTDADPPVKVYSFYINDQLIQSSGSSRIQMNSTTEGNNTYRCQPKNSVGLGANAIVFMNTKAPPNITWLPPNQSIAEGSKVLFPCNVTGSEPMNIRWKKVGAKSFYPGGSILTFNSLMKSHDGGYECSASNGNECPSVVSSTFIDVLYQPTITTPPRSALTLKENGTINLICQAHGNPLPNITWTRDSEVVSHGENLVLTKEQSAQATYTCVASNGLGVDAKANSNVVVKICENICQNNNTCVRRGTTWSCDCRRGLTGRYCEKDDPMGKKFEIKIVLVFPVWKDEYLDSSGKYFKDLEKEICYELQVLFIKTLVKCKLKIVRKGSIITETELEFNDTKTQSEIQEALTQATVNNTLGSSSLKVDASASFQAVLKDNMCETKPCLFDGECSIQGDGYKCDCKLFRYGTHCEKGLGLAAGIIIIIVVLLIIVVNVYVIAHFCCKSKKNDYDTDSMTEKDLRMGSYKVKNSNQILPAENFGCEDNNEISHMKKTSAIA